MTDASSARLTTALQAMLLSLVEYFMEVFAGGDICCVVDALDIFEMCLWFLSYDKPPISRTSSFLSLFDCNGDRFGRYAARE